MRIKLLLIGLSLTLSNQVEARGGSVVPTPPSFGQAKKILKHIIKQPPPPFIVVVILHGKVKRSYLPMSIIAAIPHVTKQHEAAK